MWQFQLGSSPSFFFLSIMRERSVHQMTALLSGIFLLLVIAACELHVRWMSYGAKHLSQCFPIRHFVCNYMHNSKTKGCVRMFYLLNNCSTIGDIYSLGYSYMRDTIDELWIQTHIATIFHSDILCILALVTRKLQVICKRWTFWMTALLSKMSIFCARPGCKIRMAS